MANTRTANAVRLEFTTGSLVQRNLSGAAFSGKATLDRNRRLLADDPHFGPIMNMPGKDNGWDIEGLAVDGSRLLVGLHEPVRFEAALTQSVSLPHGRGTNRAEAICNLPAA